MRAALVAAGAAELPDGDAEVLRVESGRPRYGVDLDDSVIPQEAGLNERAVSFTKGCYVGQETVARLFYKGKPNRHLRGLRLSAPGAAGAPLVLGEREVGTLTSSVVSPALGPIGLALVRREAEPGAELRVGDDGVSRRPSSSCRSPERAPARVSAAGDVTHPPRCAGDGSATPADVDAGAAQEPRAAARR